MTSIITILHRFPTPQCFGKFEQGARLQLSWLSPRNSHFVGDAYVGWPPFSAPLSGADPGMGRFAPPPFDNQIMQIQLIWGPYQPIFPQFRHSAPGGATRMARGGIRLVHEHTKSTLITPDPKYAFLHAFFLICPLCPFQNLSLWPKTHPFFQFCTFLYP